MTQATFWPVDPTVGRHHANPESNAAFESIVPVLGRLQAKVLGYIESRAAGCTVKEIRRELSMEHQTASARLTELSHAELIARTGTRRDRCAVWKTTNAGTQRIKDLAVKSTYSQV